MNDVFLCENDKCRHYINYNMKYIRVVAEKDDIPYCSYCNKKMIYSYSYPINYSKPIMLRDKNKKRLKNEW